MAFVTGGLTSVYPDSVHDVNRRAGESDAFVAMLRDWRDGVTAAPLGDSVYAFESNAGGVPIEYQGPPGTRGMCLRVETGAVRVTPTTQHDAAIKVPDKIDIDDDSSGSASGFHGYIDGAGPLLLVLGTATEFPEPLENAQYFVSRVDDGEVGDSRFRFHDNRADARARRSPIDLTTSGAGDNHMALGGSLNSARKAATDLVSGDSYIEVIAGQAGSRQRIVRGNAFTVKALITNSRMLFWWVD